MPPEYAQDVRRVRAHQEYLDRIYFLKQKIGELAALRRRSWLSAIDTEALLDCERRVNQLNKDYDASLKEKLTDYVEGLWT